MAFVGEIIHLQRDQYRLCAPLASSAYGVVWRALRLGAHGVQEVALKMVNQQLMQRAQSDLQHNWIASAEQEITFLQQLSSWDQRHIARLLDHGTHDSLPVFALELLQQDLGRHLKTQASPAQPVRFSQAIHWLAQINQALAKVHGYGWCYLDLKPGNVLLNQGEVKLVDFGSAAQRHVNNTLGGAAVAEQIGYRGTPNWQAPEQFFPSRTDVDGWAYSSDYRSDYFALGAMLYFLISGGLPLRFCSLCGQAFRQHGVWGAQHFAANPHITLYPDEAQLFLRMADQGQDATADGSTEASPQANAALALLQRLLASEPAARPQNALDISAALDEIAQLQRGTPEQYHIATPQPAASAPVKAEVKAKPEPHSHAGTELLFAAMVCAACILSLFLLMWPTSSAIAYALAAN